MSRLLKRNRFLISRRIIQLGLLLLFAGANWWGWKILMGTYSSAYVFESFYLADPYAVIQSFAAGIILSSNVVIGAAFVLILYSLIAGRSFCSWVCPVNILSDTAIWMRKKWKIAPKEKYHSMNRKTRYWILLLGPIISAIVGVAAFEVINPITILQRGIIFGFGIGWVLLVGLFFFDLLIVEFGWCGHLCPLGAFYSVAGHFSMIKVKHNVDKCTLCMECKDVCHEDQVLHFIGDRSGFIKNECSNCGRCIEVCDDKALKYSIYYFKN